MHDEENTNICIYIYTHGRVFSFNMIDHDDAHDERNHLYKQRG